ncbi:MAG: hypothetical protein WC197_01920 [Candidatus Gastranaerophilaceae bacterium]|jgi:hypothetical protein
MGLAASQARLLSLTARQNDNEYEGQMVNNRRLALSSRMQQIATDYSKGMSNKMIQINMPDDEGKAHPIDFNSLTSAEVAGIFETNGFVLVDSNGQPINQDRNGNYTDNNGNVISSPQIQGLLRAGTLNISNGKTVTTDDGNVSYSLAFDWRSDESGTFQDVYNTTDDAAITAIYEAQSAAVQSQDKRLEMELKTLDTEHKAIETEVDAVKKVIDKNAQSSFKTFG